MSFAVGFLWGNIFILNAVKGLGFTLLISTHVRVLIGKFRIAEHISCLNAKLLIGLSKFFGKVRYWHDAPAPSGDGDATSLWTAEH